MNKILVVGLDGGSWNLIDDLIEQDYLPNIKKLKEIGFHANLKSCLPFVTFPAWKCYSTGLDPSQLEVYWWAGINFKKRKKIYHNSRSFKGKDIWNYLSEKNLKSTIINMPSTYPTSKVNGLMISGPGGGATTDGKFVYPYEAKDKIAKKYDYKIIPESSFSGKPISKQKFLKEIKKIIRSRFKITLDYLPKSDFAHTTIFRIDDIQHHYWDEFYSNKNNKKSAIVQAWRLIDEEIGRIINKHPNINLMLMSDHGFTKLKGSFYLNEWLRREGLLVVKKNKLISSFSKSKKAILNSNFKKLLPMKLLRKSSFLVKQAKKDYEIDWKKSKAIGLPSGLIYIDKEKYSPDEQKKQAKLIKNKLLEFQRKLSTDIFKNIYHHDEIYTEKISPLSPNLIIEQETGYEIREGIDRPIFEKSTDNGWQANHRRNGVFLACGPDINQSYTNKTISIYSLAPTILYYYKIKTKKSNKEPLCDLIKQTG